MKASSAGKKSESLTTLPMTSTQESMEWVLQKDTKTGAKIQLPKRG